MDADLKAKWVKALRSGEYEQTTGRLYQAGGFCCLGVLAIVAGHSKARIEHHTTLGIVDSKLAVSLDPSGQRIVQSELENMNDGLEGKRRHSFCEIADWIETHIQTPDVPK